ncbi:aryl-sulfate sulfotransferase [Siccibacter colletis]|uniref:aryl-sulfate sulfotransferase n=1 Tax=Siccibacter colletis TaxID=1505757 RepID=UPI003CF2DE40
MTVYYVKTELAPANNQLAAYVYFQSDTAVRYDYKVLRRTTSPTSVDFVYTSEELITDTGSEIKIPVIGLYANYENKVQFIFYNQAGEEVYNAITAVSTREQSYRDATIFHLNIEQTDPELFTSIWGNSWLMTSYCDGYDRNGDLRCCFSAPYRNQMLRTHNGYFYTGSDEDLRWYGRRFYKIDILGNVVLEFDLADSDNNRFTNTHDLEWDSAGNLYMVGSDNPDRATNTLRQDAWILKFSEQTGKLIWAKNYSRDFDNTQILNNSGTNDVHLNSLSWIPAGTTTSEAIIVHSRSASLTFGIGIDDGAILWSIDTGGYNPTFLSGAGAPRLDTTGITQFENGAHTVFVTQNSAFAQYTDTAAGKFVLSLFNNHSCEDATGKVMYRPISEDAPADAFTTAPAQVLFYAVDLVAKTVTQIGDPRSLPNDRVPQITDFMGAVFDHHGYYTVYTNHARSFFIMDAAGKVVATLYDLLCTLHGFPLFPGECYRARLFDDAVLASLVDKARSVAAA